LAVRYAGRHIRQARHGAWVNKKRSRLRTPPTQFLPTAAAITVAGLLVGGASATIGLSPASSGPERPAYDPADIPPPDQTVDRSADQSAETPGALAAARAPLADDKAEPAVVATGSCEVSYVSAGRTTASGEAFDPGALTAGHRDLPFGTLVRVTNPANGESVIVRVNDRFSYRGDRCLNLSVGAFASIADPSAGVVDIRYEVLAQDAT
jgi:rare lipoprotein A